MTCVCEAGSLIAEVQGRGVLLVRSLNARAMWRVDMAVEYIVVDGWCNVVPRAGVGGGQGSRESGRLKLE